jgi:hypothetical protein
MKKLALELETLVVESFTVADVNAPKGTVVANGVSLRGSCHFTECVSNCDTYCC